MSNVVSLVLACLLLSGCGPSEPVGVDAPPVDRCCSQATDELVRECASASLPDNSCGIYLCATDGGVVRYNVCGKLTDGGV